MQIVSHRITPCLWFDSEAEDAARLYSSIFPNSRIGRISRYGKEGFEIHGRPEGSVMTVEFELDGLRLTGLNGGPIFKFTEAVSFQINCETQDEIDHYWVKLGDRGQEGPCGWLKDRFGLSWQVVPSLLPQMLTSGDAAAAGRVTRAFLQMKKFDIAALTRAYEGEAVAAS
ncbi:MAG: VOC family protein [Pseudorhodoplanes sp.]|nr:VOC family protein [Pseudorhodoplanes sp.]